jgi:DDE superfamily endonuclease
MIRYVNILNYTLQIRWENRFQGAATGQTCFTSLDGVDFKILEPQPFNPKFYSHKFKGPGLRYEIGLNIRTGHIVWKHGGYPCGQYSDLTIAREAYLLSINHAEKTIADKGYRDNRYFLLKNNLNKKIHGKIMARHETVNKRMKQFQILKQPFKNNIHKHPIVFHAVANLIELMIENGEPLFNALN